MHWKAAAALAVGLGAVGTAATPQSSGLFTEYTALVTPKSDLPIGALWIPGTGPNGAGDPANVAVNKGAAALAADTSLQQQIGLGLGSFLGLNLSKNAVRSVKLTGVEFDRVADVAKLNLKAGQQVLFEGVKADTIELTVSSDMGADAKAKAAAKGILLSADLSGKNASKITLNGSGLFLAYQVVSFGNPQVRVEEKPHKGGDVTFGNHRFTMCHCHEDGSVDVRHEDLGHPTIGGQFDVTKVTVKPGGWSQFALPVDISGGKITAANVTVAYNPQKQCNEGIVNKDGKPVCLLFFNGPDNKITLRTATFRVDRVKRPSATY